MVLAGPSTPQTLAFCERCADYLEFAVPRLNAQDQAHAETLLSRLPESSTADRAVLSDLLHVLQASREAIERLAQAHGALRERAATPDAFLDACRHYVSFFDAELGTRKHRISHLLERYYGLADWRRASRVSADSILEEKRLFTRARDSAPESVMLDA